jgi:hypothetical protein
MDNGASYFMLRPFEPKVLGDRITFSYWKRWWSWTGNQLPEKITSNKSWSCSNWYNSSDWGSSSY